MRKPLKWDDYRQMAVAPHQYDRSGYQRPDPRYCYDYGPAKPEVVATPAIKAAMSRMEGVLAKQSERRASIAMAKAVGVEAVAPHEGRHDPVDMREADYFDEGSF